MHDSLLVSRDDCTEWKKKKEEESRTREREKERMEAERTVARFDAARHGLKRTEEPAEGPGGRVTLPKTD